ncbi:MAG: hypothetical protein PHG08_01485 [Bacilli bacterium]|jgi:hypothetical protein|nr:hypothetical protein [Bacilli bacterium]HHU24107.1 hypothetical protein [Acholeplasmataceae bacterium]
MKRQNDTLVGLLSFVGLILATLFYLFSVLDGRYEMLYTISYICLLIVVFYTAWEFVRKRHVMWRFVYYVIVVLVLLGFVLGNFDIL